MTLEVGDRVYCQCWEEDPPRPTKGDRDDRGRVIDVVETLRGVVAVVEWDSGEVDDVMAESGMCVQHSFQARRIR